MLNLFVKAYPAVLVTVVALDLLWIGVIMSDFYRVKLGHLMSGNVVWGAAVVFYLLFAAGLTYFAVLPGMNGGSLIKVFILGSFLGLIAYATYDLTNHATLKDWPLIVTVVDIMWGSFLSGAAAAAGYLAIKLMS